MKALVSLGSGRFEERDLAALLAGPGEAILQVLACTLCGSDLHDAEQTTDRPRVLGHELAGRVVATGAGAEVDLGTVVAVMPTSFCGTCAPCVEGQTNLCRVSYARTLGYGLPGGLGDCVRVLDAKIGNTLFPLPPGTDPVLGALAEPAAVAYRAVARAGIQPGTGVLVLGGGPIGLLVALFAERAGALVVVVEPQGSRRAVADGLGLATAADAADDSAREAFLALRHQRPDVVVDAAGAGPVVEAGLRAVRPGGILLLVAGHGKPVALDISYLIRKEVTVLTSFAYTVDDYRAALEALLDDGFRGRDIVTHRLPRGQAERAFTLALEREGVIKIAIVEDGS